MAPYRSDLEAALARIDALSRPDDGCAACDARRRRHVRAADVLLRTIAHVASALLASTCLFAFLLTGAALLVASCALGDPSPARDLDCLGGATTSRTTLVACATAFASAALGSLAHRAFVRLERWLALDGGR